jgi:hypothetical protein
LDALLLHHHQPPGITGAFSIDHSTGDLTAWNISGYEGTTWTNLNSSVTDASDFSQFTMTGADWGLYLQLDGPLGSSNSPDPLDYWGEFDVCVMPGIADAQDAHPDVTRAA